MGNPIIVVTTNQKEFTKALRVLQKTQKALTPKVMKSMHRRNLKPMLNEMRNTNKHEKLTLMLGITTAKRRAGDYGAKIGVVKNDTALFPKFSSFATSSVIEYGTVQRETNEGANRGSMPSTPWLRPAWDKMVWGYMESTERSINKKIKDSLNGT